MEHISVFINRVNFADADSVYYLTVTAFGQAVCYQQMNEDDAKLLMKTGINVFDVQGGE